MTNRTKNIVTIIIALVYEAFGIFAITTSLEYAWTHMENTWIYSLPLSRFEILGAVCIMAFVIAVACVTGLTIYNNDK